MKINNCIYYKYPLSKTTFTLLIYILNKNCKYYYLYHKLISVYDINESHVVVILTIRKIQQVPLFVFSESNQYFKFTI